MSEAGPAVGIIMGSQSDWDTMHHAADTLSGWAWSMKPGSSQRTAHRSGSFAMPTARAPRPQGDHRRRRRRRASRRHGRALTPLPVLGVPIERPRSRASIVCFRSCRCRAGCRSGPSPSAKPAPSTRRCSPRRSWRWAIPPSRARSTAGARRRPTRCAETPARNYGAIAVEPAASISEFWAAASSGA